MIVLSPECEILYWENFVKDSDALFRTLMDMIPWVTNVTGVFNRPRRTYWYGDFDYTYHRRDPFPDVLNDLRVQLEDLVFGESRQQFRGVLLDLYRNGNDTIDFHADNEPEIEPLSPIASVSLGAERRFVLRTRSEKVPAFSSETALKLRHGSCLVMMGATQRDFRHGIPAEPTITDPCINLTFRKYVQSGG